MTDRVAAALVALADPTRRAVFERVVRAPAAVADIAAGLPVTRPAVSQHLKVLKEAGLVSDTQAGTRHIYRIDPRGLATVRAWLDQMWAAQLEAFKSFADNDGEQHE